jgi:putative acetyltransferase
MIIRPVKLEDAHHISEISSDSSVRKSMNISQAGFSDAEKLIKHLTPLDHLLVLETEVKPIEICGVVLLRVDPQIYLRRQATLEIMMGAKWQGQGLGKALMMAALELADKELMLERVEVEIALDNLNALKLCKSMGFKVEGTAKDWAMSDDGNYIDAYLLARLRNWGLERR